MTAVVTNITGCRLMSNKERMEKAKVLLEEKYQEEFEILEYQGIINIAEEEYKVMAAAKNSPDILFEAKASGKESYLSDEYITAKVCRLMEEQMLRNLGSMKGYLKVKIQAVSKTIASSDSKMSIQEYMTLKPSNLYAVYLHYHPLDVDGKVIYENMQKAFVGMGNMSGAIELYIVDEDKLKEIASYLKECAILDEQYKELLSEVIAIRIPFKNGNIQLTEEELVKEIADRL